MYDVERKRLILLLEQRVDIQIVGSKGSSKEKFLEEVMEEHPKLFKDVNFNGKKKKKKKCKSNSCKTDDKFSVYLTDKHIFGKKLVSVYLREPELKDMKSYFKEEYELLDKEVESLFTYSKNVSGRLPESGAKILEELHIFNLTQGLTLLDSLDLRKKYEFTDKGLIEATNYTKENDGIINKIVLDKQKELFKPNLKTLASDLKKRVVGQDKSMDKITNILKRRAIGFKKTGKPTASVLLLGRSGVGKTETAKMISELIYGHKEIVRFDMSEYSESHSVQKFTGSPAGYVGYSDGGLLTSAVSKNPECVMLFDEVEKAHKNVYDTLLQVLDEGILTDNRGNKFSFKNVIIILTSNISVDLESFFRPEFLNRLDLIEELNPLTTEVIKVIYNKEIANTLNSCLELGYDIATSKRLDEFICKEGFSIKNGARELKRAIERHIEDNVTNAIMNDEIVKEFSYTIDFKSSKVIFIKGESFVKEKRVRV